MSNNRLRSGLRICAIVVLFSARVISAAFADEIPIGVPLPLTGDAAQSGEDIRNALLLANEMLGQGRYRLIIDDEKCENKDALTVANKLIAIDKVQYAIGFFCNSTLIATADVYQRAKVVVIASASTGDIVDVGSHIFRLFPADVGCAQTLYRTIAKEHRRVTILTEQNEYPEMMERVLRRSNDASKEKIGVESFEYTHGQTDLRTLALKVRNSEAVFVNSNTDPSFLSVMKQLHDQHYKGEIYSAYFGSSPAIRESLGPLIEGVKFCDLPALDELISPTGKAIMAEFRKRFGEPKSGFPVVPPALESFRLLDVAIRSGMPVQDYLHNRQVNDGILPPYRLDEHGAVQGIAFQMKAVKDGKVIVLPAQ